MDPNRKKINQLKRKESEMKNKLQEISDAYRQLCARLGDNEAKQIILKIENEDMCKELIELNNKFKEVHLENQAAAAAAKPEVVKDEATAA